MDLCTLKSRILSWYKMLIISMDFKNFYDDVRIMYIFWTGARNDYTHKCDCELPN
jgi:hypothetical protein